VSADAPAAFFSYCRDDSDFALRLAEDLKGAGAVVWMDQLDIEPGQEWDSAVEDAVTRCPRMLLILSPASVKSRNVRNEIAFALDEQKTIIPVLLQDCTVPLQLRRIQHIDFRTDYARGLKALLKALGVQQSAPRPASPEPDETGRASATATAAEPAPTPRGPVPAAVSTKVIAFDLGATNSRVALMEEDTPSIITGEDEGSAIASLVAFTDDGERLVGIDARRVASRNTIASIKRMMGRRYDEIADEVKMTPHRVLKRGGHVALAVRGKEYTPPELFSLILQKLKQAVEEHLGETVTRAVITVPAYFNDAQRQATRKAGNLAGLEVARLINDTTAAALAYAFDYATHETIAVYALGGGAFSVSILEVGDGVVEVRSTSGDTGLGGQDIDQRIVDWLIDEFKNDQGIDLHGDELAMQRLSQAAERAKIELSTIAQTEINLPYITADASGPKHMAIKLTRSKLERLASDILDRTAALCKGALADAGLAPDQIHNVILAGGQTRMPKVRALIEDLFGKAPRTDYLDADDAVVRGAAICGGVLAGEVKDVLVLDVTPLTLSIETMGGVATPMILRNSTIPTRKAEVFSTATDNQTAVEIHVMQGESAVARENRSLGKLELRGIPAAPRGTPQIEVTFDIDADGILNVTAKDRATGKDQTVTITSAG
jgi:molecular chaperone DnaK